MIRLNSFDHCLLALFICIISFSCKKKCSTLSEYLKWLNDPEKHLAPIKRINGIAVKVKYLPAEYLAYMEEEKDSQHYLKAKRDSVINSYKESITFLLTIGPDEEKKASGDVVFRGIENYQQFSERIATMNFHMDESLNLKTDEGDHAPVLTNMENSYGLSESRNIYCVFVRSEAEKKNINDSQTFDFVYNDEIFGIGKNHFVFQKSDMEDLPEFTFWKK